VFQWQRAFARAPALATGYLLPPLRGSSAVLRNAR